MSFQSFFELSSSFLSPKDIGASPFPLPIEKRTNLSAPWLFEVLYAYSMCTKRALNTRMIGFSEPTLQSCVDDLSMGLKATQLVSKNEEALRVYNERKACKIDPTVLPWAPRKEYLEWLKKEERLL
ncbi:hypothetical protein AGDE_02373 [Angomonas deanei]|uniref:Uncharacterized protein n=1 Tax=Angomonas deanei TaxID=59799 RepID=S9WQD2_9TRYP|nr:hypothetical protein AGDE_02742 [Angomonas deanei]EPY41551.1 hypothetical protein AGDE_02373 [Angomonas deanei]CAD2221603.1 hypothetical protein, conserved [Angomonas deanei]|eukprot:EPY41183.1 hypothetical protein AGDE_02742 [Angomonas deanei]